MRSFARSFRVVNSLSRTFFTSSSSSSSTASAFSSSFNQAGKRGYKTIPSMVSRPSATNGARHYGSTASSSSNSVMKLVAAGAGIGLLAAIAPWGAEAESNKNTFLTRTRDRLMGTYAYVGVGLAGTAVTSVLMFRSGLAHVMARHPIITMIGSMAATMGSSMLVHSISSDNRIAKNAAFALFIGSVSAAICPIVAVGGAIATQAAAGTALIVGAISALAASAPSENFLWMRGPLTVGLGVVFAASLGSMAFPAVPILYSVVTYGGLLVFGGFTLYDTARIIELAQKAPHFDAVDQSLSIYMNVVNIFIRMVSIIAGRDQRRR